MEDNKELVVDTEKVETTTEQIEGGEILKEEPVIEQPTIKTYSDKEVDDIVQRRLQRQERQLKKEYNSKYGELENILKVGLNVDSIEEATNQMKDFYKSKGVEVPTMQNNYDEFDIQVLAKAEAESMIDDYSFEEIKEEVDRLADKGLDGMNAREKELFKNLAEYRQAVETREELESLGVSEDVFTSSEYIEFTSKLNPNLSERDKYEMYAKYKPTEEVETIGSMKNYEPEKTKKDYYSPQEARMLSEKDLKDPEIMKVVEESMTRWYKEHIE